MVLKGVKENTRVYISEKKGEKIMTKTRRDKLEKSLLKIAELKYYLECLRWTKEEREILNNISEGIRSELEGEKK
jgi:hypothetical protein